MLGRGFARLGHVKKGLNQKEQITQSLTTQNAKKTNLKVETYFQTFETRGYVLHFKDDRDASNYQFRPVSIMKKTSLKRKWKRS